MSDEKKGKVKYESYDGNEEIRLADCIPIWDTEGNCLGFVQKIEEPPG